MAPEETGARIRRVLSGSSADGLLRPGDVILAVNGRPVANDGSVADGDVRISFGGLVDRLQIGATVELRVLRDGERFELEAPLLAYPAAESFGNVYDRRPRYFVYAGLVFVVLDFEVLKTYGQNWYNDAPKTLLHEYLVRPSFEPERLAQERVVLLRRLEHPVNANLAWSRDQVLERVNGREITSLDVLIDTLEHSTGDYHLLEFTTGRRFAVLDRKRAERANAEILERYGIPQDGNR